MLRILQALTLSLSLLGADGLGLPLFEALLNTHRLQSQTLKSFPREPEKEYDFIVVGSGPGGSVVANRISEDPTNSVLLLEAGTANSVITEVPVLNPYLVLTDYSWAFNCEKQDGICLGYEEETCPWPSGKGAGGGSGMNAMIYTRGNPKDFDAWEAAGAIGWSYRDVLPYFRKSERVTAKSLWRSPYHGTNGSLSVGFVPFTTPLLKAFLQAGILDGYKITDYNSAGGHIGYSQIQATVQANGMRSSSANAFIAPIIRRRHNFHFALNTPATRVLIDPTTKRAYGVEIISRGRKRVILARKEVILSAGAFNTPQLLMLSGIGHREHLEEMRIPVIQDLPVGDNLQEHIGMNGLVFLIDQDVTNSGPKVVRNMLQNTINLANKGQGPLTSLGCEGISFIRTPRANQTELDVPDIELLFVPSSVAAEGSAGLRKTFDMTDSLFNSVYKPIEFKTSFTIWPILLYPKSTGYVRLRNRNPLNKVKIVANFLQNEDDLWTMVEGIKAAIRIGTSEPFKRFGVRLHDIPFPDCEDLGFGSDEYWACTVRQVTSQFHHQCCTAAIGKVLDHRLRVIGVQGLRVADTSAMPSIPGAHTQAGAYMIGEKAADMIKQDWNIA